MGLRVSAPNRSTAHARTRVSFLPLHVHGLVTIKFEANCPRTDRLTTKVIDAQLGSQGEGNSMTLPVLRGYAWMERAASRLSPASPCNTPVLNGSR